MGARIDGAGVAGNHTRAGLDALLRQHRPLVRRLAGQMLRKLPANVEFDDLLQVGMIGLQQALERFDAAQGVQFEAFATQRIRGAMLDELRAADWMSRASRRNWRAVETATAQLQNRLGREPSSGELAAEMGLTLAQFQSAQTLAYGVDVFSLESLSGVLLNNSEDPLEWLETAQVCDAAGDQIDAARVSAWIAEAIAALPERERAMWVQYHDDGATLAAMGAQHGVHDVRIWQLLKQAEGRVVAYVRAKMQPGKPVMPEPEREPQWQAPPADVAQFAGVRW